MLCSPSRPYAHPHPQPPSPEAGEPEMAAFLGEVPASASRGHCESVLLVSLFEKRPPSPRNARPPPLRCPHPDGSQLALTRGADPVARLFNKKAG